MGAQLQPDNIFSIPNTAVIRPDPEAGPEDWKLLRRLKLPRQLDEPTGAPRAIGLVVDTETTGTDLSYDEVIQLALLPFSFEPSTGRLCVAGEKSTYVGLREPKVEMNPAAQAVHGITPEMLQGKSVNTRKVQTLVEQADIIVAHHASFDRPMVEKHWPVFRNRSWACSLEDIAWQDHGFNSRSLESLATEFGFFYNPHDALEDCRAVLGLLTRRSPDGHPLFAEMYTAAKTPRWLVCAEGAPFQAREVMKDRGYHWRPDHLPAGKVWWIETDDPEAESDWLATSVYVGKDADRRPAILSIPSRSRFSEDIWRSLDAGEPLPEEEYEPPFF